MNKLNLFDAWSRFGSEVLHRMPVLSPDPRRFADWTRGPAKIATEMHDAWLENLGGVSRSRYLEVLEENLELRRRIEALEKAQPATQAAAATTEAIDGAFKQMRDAQQQWLSLWLPNANGATKKS